MVEVEDDEKADSKSTSKSHSLARQALAAALRRFATGSFTPMKDLYDCSSPSFYSPLSSLPSSLDAFRFLSPARADFHLSDPDLPILNSTLLKFAESDPNKDCLRQEIAQLIEGNFDKVARYFPFLIWHLFTTAADLRARTSHGVPVSLRSPAFYCLYLQFRILLSESD